METRGISTRMQNRTGGCAMQPEQDSNFE